MQGVKPTAELTAVAERAGVHAGNRIRLALKVILPAGLHVQANTPRDPLLIPTVLTIDAPAGVRVVETVYPKSTDLTQAGQAVPLAVFDHEFVVGVNVEIGRALPLGDLSVPARLRYQACDDRVCFAPTTVRFAWTLRVVPDGEPTPLQHREIFEEGDGALFHRNRPNGDRAP